VYACTVANAPRPTSHWATNARDFPSLKWHLLSAMAQRHVVRCGVRPASEVTRDEFAVATRPLAALVVIDATDGARHKTAVLLHGDLGSRLAVRG
jgi:hypothetical protein